MRQENKMEENKRQLAYHGGESPALAHTRISAEIQKHSEYVRCCLPFYFHKDPAERDAAHRLLSVKDGRFMLFLKCS